MNDAAHRTDSSTRERSGFVSGDGAGLFAQGLTAEEARALLVADGPNELSRKGTRSVWTIMGEALREPMLMLLLAGGLVYLLLGARVEALILLGFASFSIVLTVVQETRTEHVLEALRDLSAPRALVIRDGQSVRIALFPKRPRISFTPPRLPVRACQRDGPDRPDGNCHSHSSPARPGCA